MGPTTALASRKRVRKAMSTPVDRGSPSAPTVAMVPMASGSQVKTDVPSHSSRKTIDTPTSTSIQTVRATAVAVRRFHGSLVR
jgi:hypothetical protein